jgi:ABC-type multidrug transport system fused ATPase/permease subunit
VVHRGPPWSRPCNRACRGCCRICSSSPPRTGRSATRGSARRRAITSTTGTSTTPTSGSIRHGRRRGRADGAALGRLDPPGAAVYAERLVELRRELADLDHELATTLARCAAGSAGHAPAFGWRPTLRPHPDRRRAGGQSPSPTSPRCSSAPRPACAPLFLQPRASPDQARAVAREAGLGWACWTRWPATTRRTCASGGACSPRWPGRAVSAAPVIRVRDLDPHRPPAVLRGVTSTSRLDFVSVIGPNGGGKSTLLKLLLGCSRRGGARSRCGPPSRRA